MVLDQLTREIQMRQGWDGGANAYAPELWVLAREFFDYALK
jgi:hypothetical protein